MGLSGIQPVRRGSIWAKAISAGPCFSFQPNVYFRRYRMSRYTELQELLASFEKDFEKFYDKGNKSAGTRVRKAMNDLKRLAQDIRKEVQEMKTDKPEETTSAS